MIPKIIAGILGSGRFPPPIGQGLPDPGPLDVRPEVPVSQDERDKALDRPIKPPKPPKP